MFHILEREKNTSKNKHNKVSQGDLEHHLVVNKIVNLKEEQELQTVHGIADKVFASCWYDNNTIFAGTKDNRLIRFNLDGKKDKFQEVSLIASDRRVSSDCCGIHSIAINPASTLLVTGGMDPSDLGVYKLPNMAPLFSLTGHKNWSFACDFLNNETVISGSRDKSVSIWSVNKEDASFCRQPIATKINHNHKVRELKVMHRYNKFATLSSDCTLKIWDIHSGADISVTKTIHKSADFSVTKTIGLEGKQDLVSLAVDDKIGIIAVGSQSKISLFDTKNFNLIKEIDSLDENQGVRSLNIAGNIVSIGGALGRLSFFDLTKQEYMKVNSSDSHYFKTGKGWNLNDSYAVKHAVYTHKFNHSVTKLFVAGGPINFHDVGSYAAIWS